MEDIILVEKFMSFVRWLVREVSDIQAAHAAMIERGMTEEASEEEIARAFFGAMFEQRLGMPDKLSEVFRRLQDGESTADLFPYLYGSGAGRLH